MSEDRITQLKKFFNEELKMIANDKYGKTFYTYNELSHEMKIKFDKDFLLDFGEESDISDVISNYEDAIIIKYKEDNFRM